MKYLISLGSNVGNGLDNISKAIMLLEDSNITVDEYSSVYCSSPVDFVSQADFINVSAIIDADLYPEELLIKLKKIEKDMGRIKTIPKGPRNIDLDILFWENGTHSSRNLTIPHKQAMNRLFVIFPTLEIIEKLDVFEEEKLSLQDSLENKKERFAGQRVEKLCPLNMEKVIYEWKNR
ncbi:MAG TPA: 2-amino-4-hydroxy-6-hydroxymethyldihydropteridine diphosphokinase [bacterium]|nr:2-amino-4-hydroxy-6-hydroxymethyldihydropteridine diphosphokinase [bacterium]HPS28817.1 2-amino-4-hydroxy-6-hydroxymethyldihydropteridine diphosphokinase [bacterium]